MSPGNWDAPQGRAAQEARNRQTNPSNPACQPCRTCANFQSRAEPNGKHWGFCIAIKDEVQPWWTGCVRHLKQEEPAIKQ